MRCTGHTLIEVLTVALIISILACVAVPRLNLGAVRGSQTDAIVRRLATDLRRARAQAIVDAARNPEGFALVMNGGDSYYSYQILDRHDRTAVTTCEIPAGVQCRGGKRFAFGPLGNLQDSSDTQLRVSSEGKAYLLEIVPATGAVTWRRCDR